MAAAYDSDEETYPPYNADFSNITDSESSDSDDMDSDEFSDLEGQQGEPCMYYNRGNCRNGSRCQYLHVCKYFLKGNCRNGSNCKVNHSGGARPSSGESSRDAAQDAGVKLTNGRYYQWQLYAKGDWKDIDNDHVIEAQYCLPHSKGIKIYNTLYGVVSIDFKKMKVYKDGLRVRRLDDGNTEWAWYCTLRRKWIKYGEKDAKGMAGPVKSAEIESTFQRNPTGSYAFTLNGEQLEIKFKEMQQVGKSRKRKVARRPVFRMQTTGLSQVLAGLQNVSIGTKPQWQFERNNRSWSDFKNRQYGTSTECSVTSDDIERAYQQNQSGSMTFNINREPYKLDFRAMTQTNQVTRKSRSVRRVLL